MRLFCLSLLIIPLLACSSLVPAAVPLQLEATAGASIIITDEWVDAGLFIVNYPDGWRVVRLSLAGDPIFLVFAAPDAASLMLSNRGMILEISEAPIGIIDVTPDASIYERFETVSKEALTVYLRGQSPIEHREEFDVIYQQVMESILFR